MIKCIIEVNQVLFDTQNYEHLCLIIHYIRFIFEISEVPREPDLPMIRHCFIEMILRWLVVKKKVT